MNKISKEYFDKLLSITDKQEVKDFLISNEKVLVCCDPIKIKDKIKTLSDIENLNRYSDNYRVSLLIDVLQFICFIETGLNLKSDCLSPSRLPKTEKIFNTYFDINKLILNGDEVFEEYPLNKYIYFNNVRINNEYVMQVLLDVLKSHEYTELNMSKKIKVQDLCEDYIYVRRDDLYDNKIRFGVDKLYNLIYELDNINKTGQQYFKMFYKRLEVK